MGMLVEVMGMSVADNLIVEARVNNGRKIIQLYIAL